MLAVASLLLAADVRLQPNLEGTGPGGNGKEVVGSIRFDALMSFVGRSHCGLLLLVYR